MNTLDNKHTEENQQDDVRQTGGLTERLKRVKTTRWIRFGVVSVIFFAWVYWLGNWWVAPWWLRHARPVYHLVDPQEVAREQSFLER